MRTFLLFILFSFFSMQAQVATTVEDFFMPGSQPLESGDLTNPANCNCHDNYDHAVEPYFNWEGSMMAHAAKDLLFLATMTIANQDADSSGELCLRCHTPTGWLSGRSDDPQGGSLTDEDRTSVNCLFCHRSLMPADQGTNPFPSDPNYIDPDCTSTGISTYISDSTYMADSISDHIPPNTANGMFVVTDEDERRGPYSNPANPNHGFYYSPFHLSSEICGTCHDVSNPVYDNNGDGTYSLNALDTRASDFSPYAMFPIERTYSEWLNSDYPSGVSGTSFGGNKAIVSSCQDCHMRDVTGEGVGTGNPPLRNDLALHDMTGGNTFMPDIINVQFPSTTNATALDSGVSRATRMLQLAATLEATATLDTVYVTVTNETGHKFPSGYPEGRRIWLNVKAYNNLDQLIYESGNYDAATGVLTQDADIKIYEIKPGLTAATAASTGNTAGPSFHFVLNDTIYSDNRIPPRGFTNAAFEAIQSEPVGYTYADGQYWDNTNYGVGEMPDSVIVTLYYQTTSKEYVEFLRDENVTDTRGDDMYNYWDTNGKSAPVMMAQVTLGTNDINLPVELTAFTANVINKNVILKWETSSELNNQGFEILRSDTKLGDYKLIASYATHSELQGHGNSSIGHKYSFIDKTVFENNIYWYQLVDVDYNGVRAHHGPISITVKTDQGGEDDPIEDFPLEFKLSQNYPNPFNPKTHLKISIPNEDDIGMITIDIYDIMGKKVKSVFEGHLEPGVHPFEWNGRDNSGQQLSGGTYFLYFKSDKYNKIKKMILVK